MAQLFRGGFICVSSEGSQLLEEDPRETTKGWLRVLLPGAHLLVDPETPVSEISSGADSVRILGDVFSLDGRSISEIATEMLRAETDNSEFGCLDALSGRFCLIRQKASQLRFYHDAFGARSLFYHADRGVGALASHAALIANTLGLSTDVRSEKLVGAYEYTKRVVKYLPGDWTMFQDVYALIPNNYFDWSAGRPVRYWPRRSLPSATLEQFTDIADQYLSAFSAFLRGRRPVLGITGGIDSKGLMAAFRYYELPFDGVTWSDPYLRRGERAVIEALQPFVTGDYTWLRFKSDRKGDPIADIANENVGFYRGLASPRLLTVHMQDLAKPGAVFIRGYGGEIMRGFYNTFPHPIPSYEPQHFARAYGTSGSTTFYTKASLAAAEGFWDRANYAGIAPLGYDPNDLFYWEQRMGCWGSAMLNEMDPAIYSVVGYNSRPLFEAAFGLGPSIRLNKGLIARLIERYDPAMSAVPVV